MRTPERIATDRLRPGLRTNTGPGSDVRGGIACSVHDQVLDCSGALPAAKTVMRFRQSGATRGFRHGVFSRGGSF